MGAESKLVGERTRKILEDLAERMIPSGGIDYPGARDIGLVDKVLVLADTKIPMGILGLKTLDRCLIPAMLDDLLPQVNISTMTNDSSGHV